MNLEQYIAKRKQEDKLNEFDLTLRSENTRACVNYVFEFFNDYYVDTADYIEQPVTPDDKVENYKNMVRDYDDEVRDWLVSMYIDNGKYIHRILTNAIDDDPFFLLYNTDTEFRALSYRVYIGCT